MKLEFLRDLPDDEKEGAIAFMDLMNGLDPKSLALANIRDFCARDKEFIDRLKWLAGVDESIVGRVILVRKKLLRVTESAEAPIPLVQRDADTISETAWKGFYDTGLYIRGLNFSDLDLSGGFIYGDYVCANAVINGECNEADLFIKGRYMREGRQIKGKYKSRGLKVLGQQIENSLQPTDVVFSEPPKRKETLRAGFPAPQPVTKSTDEPTEDDFEIKEVPAAQRPRRTVPVEMPRDAKLPKFPSQPAGRSRLRLSKPPQNPIPKTGAKPPPKPVQGPQPKIKARTSMSPRVRSVRPRSQSVQPKTNDIDGDWSTGKK
jgi:hypothetical protein